MNSMVTEESGIFRFTHPSKKTLASWNYSVTIPGSQKIQKYQEIGVGRGINQRMIFIKKLL